MHNLHDILKKIDVTFKIIGREDTNLLFEKILPLPFADKNSLIFFNKPNEKTLEGIKSSDVSVILVEKIWGENHKTDLTNCEKNIILVENPRLVVAKIMKIICVDEDKNLVLIDPSAKIHPDAKIHPTAKIGANCIIGCCEIGENSVIMNFSTVKDNVKIGKNVVIREYCLIGGTGFGFVRDENDIQWRLEHIGGVIIEDNVEIFPYTNIDRATFTNTIVGQGTKIDHYCHIGHNCEIGRNNTITAQVVTAGGVKIGNNCWVGVGSILKEKVCIGDNVTLGLNTVVLKDVPSNSIYVGVPAKPINGKK